ncbi:MAG: hypothetical protein KTR14_11680 [Vampirovibrio sp.]|nr:hypothetical protein [Vampirovibrio sp.]
MHMHAALNHIWTKSLLSASLLAGLTIGLTGLGVAQAETPLADIENFEVYQFRKGFLTKEQNVPPEIFAFLFRELAEKKAIPMASPGQGIIDIHCQGPGCVTLKTTVTDGKDGPVVWEGTTRRKYFMGLIPYDERTVAKRIAEDLMEAYEEPGTME